jgi:hypothetical protein
LEILACASPHLSTQFQCRIRETNFHQLL